MVIIGDSSIVSVTRIVTKARTLLRPSNTLKKREREIFLFYYILSMRSVCISISIHVHTFPSFPYGGNNCTNNCISSRGMMMMMMNVYILLFCFIYHYLAKH